MFRASWVCFFKKLQTLLLAKCSLLLERSLRGCKVQCLVRTTEV